MPQPMDVAVSVTTTQSGVVLSGLHKAYGSVQAVRGIDLCHRPRRDGRPARPERCGQDDDDRHDPRLTRPDGGPVTVFGCRRPTR